MISIFFNKTGEFKNLYELKIKNKYFLKSNKIL
jgi:hypothetical protein